jgi:hypothetical protein
MDKTYIDKLAYIYIRDNKILVTFCWNSAEIN